MAELVVVVPSRERPAAARGLAMAFTHTCELRTVLIFAVGEDDPTLPDYQLIPLETNGPVLVEVRVVPAVDRPSTMNFALNHVANALVESPGGPFVIGFMGDDHQPRTCGWDRRYVETLRELGTGLVYGDDQLQGARLPTQVAMTADIVRGLGYMAPPDLWHMYVDNFWRDLGLHAGCIRYLPDVVIEHMHPIAGKSPWTEGHQRVNAADIYAHDGAVYGRYFANELPLAVATIQALQKST